MAKFLSPEWFVELNEKLKSAGPAPLEDTTSVFRVVLEFTDGPSSSPHALTFNINAEGAFAESGDHLAANTVIRLSFSDAEALTNGTIDSAATLRSGRMKVRGDIQSLAPLLGWITDAHQG